LVSTNNRNAVGKTSNGMLLGAGNGNGTATQFSSYRHQFTFAHTGLTSSQIAFIDNQIQSTYPYLASKVYGENDIHILWALIVAPEDAEVSGSRIFSWGMMQGAHKPNSNGVPVEVNFAPETATYPVDGLLTTRIHDESSKQNIDVWYRNFVENNVDDQPDDRAYRRFSFGNGTLWASNVTENEIVNNRESFRTAYIDLWNRNNPIDSAIRKVSDMNEDHKVKKGE
jgi:hypothetical protein